LTEASVQICPSRLQTLIVSILLACIQMFKYVCLNELCHGTNTKQILFSISALPNTSSIKLWANNYQNIVSKSSIKEFKISPTQNQILPGILSIHTDETMIFVNDNTRVNGDVILCRCHINEWTDHHAITGLFRVDLSELISQSQNRLIFQTDKKF